MSVIDELIHEMKQDLVFTTREWKVTNPAGSTTIRVNFEFEFKLFVRNDSPFSVNNIVATFTPTDATDITSQTFAPVSLNPGEEKELHFFTNVVAKKEYPIRLPIPVRIDYIGAIIATAEADLSSLAFDDVYRIYRDIQPA